jgi:ribonucleoside-triphosphate reductase
MEAVEYVTEKCKYNTTEEAEELTINKFFDILDKKIHEAKDSLIDRFKYISSQSPKSGKFMYENNTMGGYHREEGIVSALKHGTLVIGQLGLAETLEILIGCDHTTEKGMELAKRIETLFGKRCAEFKQEYKLNFGVYYTPAENLCFTAFKKWKEKYGDMENVTYYIDEEGNRQDKLYFTNSIHVPVYKKMSPFDKIDIEAQLTGYSNAGCITYVEVLHDAIHNIDALEELVNYAMEKDIPYFALNLPSDTCTDCGYQGHIGDKCPKCGSENIERLRRVTGYLTGDYHSAFNAGKVVEADQRVNHVNETKFC